MAGPTVLTSEPPSIVAGDTVTWTTSSSQFAAGSGYLLKYFLIGPLSNPIATPITLDNGVNGVTITQVAPTLYTVAVPGSFTSTWAPGTYTWSRAFFSGSNRYTEGGTNAAGFILVIADPTVAPLPTHATRTLAKIEAALEILASGTRTSVSVDGISYTQSNAIELYKQRAMYRAEVLREQSIARAAKGLPTVTRIVPQFIRHSS